MSSGLILPAHLARGGAPIIGASVASTRDPEPPASVLRELQREDPRWFLKFGQFPKPHWDVCERWNLGDPKRARIRAGEIPPDADYDVICYCPPDIRSDDVVGYVRSRLVRVVDAQKQAERELAAIDQANRDAKQRRLDGVRQELERQHANMTSHEANLLAGATDAHTMIQGADLT